jgi:hypothetical protein
MEVREGGIVDKDSFKIFEAGRSFRRLWSFVEGHADNCFYCSSEPRRQTSESNRLLS